VGFFPFYAGKSAYDEAGHVVAYQRQYLLLTRRWDSRETHQTSGWSFLFSLIRGQSQPKRDEIRFLPLFWKSTWYASKDKDAARSRTRYIFLWPLFWLDSDRRDPAVQKRSTVLAPFYWHHRQTHVDEQGESGRSRSLTLWPLVTYSRDGDGSRHFWLLSHGWKDATEGYKRNYRALFDLFQYHRWANGERETLLLWQLYEHRRGAEGRYLAVGPLLTWDTRSIRKTFSLLAGLLAYERLGERRRWRLLYIPLGRLEPAEGD